jgi:hypothetical protein
MAGPDQHRDKLTSTEDPGKTLDNVTTFLTADLAYYGQALLQNEQMGEGRFRFFLGLITAVSAGLVALHTADYGSRLEGSLPGIVTGSLLGLLFFGVLTYLRMLQRDRVTEQYKKQLDHIRCHLRDALPLENYNVKPPSIEGVWIELRAGYAQTVGAVCSLLAGVLAFYDLHLFFKGNFLNSSITALLICGCLVYGTWVVARQNRDEAARQNRDEAEKEAES